jgi:hypothetical protein
VSPNCRFALAEISPNLLRCKRSSRAGILDTDKRPILQTLGTHAKHVGTIGDGGYGVDCIRKEFQKHLLQLYSIGSDGRKVVEKR